MGRSAHRAGTQTTHFVKVVAPGGGRDDAGGDTLWHAFQHLPHLPPQVGGTDDQEIQMTATQAIANRRQTQIMPIGELVLGEDL